MKDEAGQALLEFLASIVTVVLTVSMAGWMLHLEWDKGKCVYLAFEYTHAQVANSPPPLSPAWYSAPVHVRNLPSEAQGNAQCGQASESVSLPKLDPEAPEMSEVGNS